MYFYKAFGINIQSEICMPQFEASDDETADVLIRFGGVKSLLPPNFEDGRATRISETDICFFWEQVGWYLVRNGKEIIVDPYPEAEEKILRLPLMGIALATLLQQRGIFVLHASAISIEDAAVAFIGWKGAGKSTTAAMLYKRGHTVVSDDVVAVDMGNGRPTVLPGIPSFKLMPEAAQSVLADNPNSLSVCYTGAEKRYRSFSDNFLKKNIPLKAIFALDKGADIKAELLNPQEAITTLIANVYLARYGKQLMQNSHGIKNLRQCAEIVKHIPIYRLERPKSFQLLEEVAELLESKVASLRY